MSGMRNNYAKLTFERNDHRFIFFDDGNPSEIERVRGEMIRLCMGRPVASVASQYRASDLPVPVIGVTEEEKRTQESGEYEALAGE